MRAALLGAALVSLTATAPSATQVQSGVLACNVAPGIGFVIGSSKTLSCVFHPVRGRPEYYAGAIGRIGLDIGATGPGQFAWGVFTAGPPGNDWQALGSGRSGDGRGEPGLLATPGFHNMSGLRPRSSMDRAPDFGSGGCEFESCRGYHPGNINRLQLGGWRNW